MADLLQQAAIGDDEAFRLRVRQAVIARALAERKKPVDQTTEPAQALAIAVLERTDEWAVQVARGLATITGQYPSITLADQIPDTEIVTFLDSIFAAYLK